MIENYSEHRPHTKIYQTREVVTDGAVTTGMAALIGAAIYRNSVSNLHLLVDLYDQFTNSSGGTTAAIPFTSTCGVIADKNSRLNSLMDVAPIFQWKANESDETPSSTQYMIKVVKVLKTGGQKVFDLFQSNPFNGDADITAATVNASNKTISFTYTATFQKNVANVYVVMDFGIYAKEDTTMRVIDATVSIADIFGPVTIDNPLGFSCQLALVAGGGTSFYAEAAQLQSYIAVGLDADNNPKLNLSKFLYTTSEVNDVEVTDYIALRKATNNPNARFISPISLDPDVCQRTKELVLANSTPDVQHWMHMYIGSNWENEVIAAQGSTTSITANINTVIAECRRYNSDRVVVVWCDSPKVAITGDDSIPEYVNLPLPYIAAAIAVLRSSVLPQQPISMVNLPWIFSAPSTYSKYNTQDLNEMGAYGAFIIAQDIEYGSVYIRHQLTTDTDNGMLYYEDSVGVNFDNVCYGTKSLIRDKIGKYNITDQLVKSLHDDVEHYLTGLTQMDAGVDPLIGPQVISYTNYTVWRDVNLKDRLHIAADLELPAPFNAVVVHYNGYIDAPVGSVVTSNV